MTPYLSVQQRNKRSLLLIASGGLLVIFISLFNKWFFLRLKSHCSSVTSYVVWGYHFAW